MRLTHYFLAHLGIHHTKCKAKGKGGTAQSEAKGNPKRKASGGPTSQVPKKGCSEKFC